MLLKRKLIEGSENSVPNAVVTKIENFVLVKHLLQKLLVPTAVVYLLAVTHISERITQKADFVFATGNARNWVKVWRVVISKLFSRRTLDWDKVRILIEIKLSKRIHINAIAVDMMSM